MSLELKIEALTAAVVALTAEMQSRHSMIAQLQAGNVAAPAHVAPTPAPVVQAALAPVAPPVAVAPAMPAPPLFVAPATVTVSATGAPFTDGKGLIDYVMNAYKALGPQKGALIQGVLTGLGYQNINDVKPEHYAALHTGVEGLK